jgi:hypothetical protein
MAQPQSSTFLRLPAELRNTIYELVFTERSKIIPHTGDASNQLRFVCQQLCQETSWLEFRYNNSITLIRQDVNQTGPTRQLIKLPKRAFDYLCTVVSTHGTYAASYGPHSI